MKRPRLEDAPRSQKLAGLARVIDAARAIVQLPAITCPQGQIYDVGTLAIWGQAVAADLGLNDAANELESIVDDWFTGGRVPTLTADEVNVRLVAAAVSVELAIRQELAKCA